MKKSRARHPKAPPLLCLKKNRNRYDALRRLPLREPTTGFVPVACCTTAERGQAFQSVADRQSPIGLGKPLLLHLANMPLSPLVRVLLARPPNDYRLD